MGLNMKSLFGRVGGLIFACRQSTEGRVGRYDKRPGFPFCFLKAGSHKQNSRD